jgi:hypothetical protein
MQSDSIQILPLGFKNVTFVKQYFSFDLDVKFIYFKTTLTFVIQATAQGGNSIY